MAYIINQYLKFRMSPRNIVQGPIVMSDGSVILVEIAAGRVTRLWGNGRREVITSPGRGPNGAGDWEGATFDFLRYLDWSRELGTRSLRVRRGAAGQTLRSWQVGDVTITRIDELLVPAPPSMVFAGGSPEHVARHPWLKPHFVNDEGNLLMSIHGFVVESNGLRIMAESCVGNGKRRHLDVLNMLQTSFFDDLNAAGFSPETFDIVLCTHLHADHCGWSTRQVDGRWVPTFPKARFLIGRVEYENTIQGKSNEQDWPDVYEDTLRPLLENGLCDFVEVDHRINDEIRLIETHGHTPGHVSIMIESKGKSALITGDMIHHPIQFSELALCSNFDHDAAHAKRTRERFITECSGKDVLVLGCHFADPTGGWVVPNGEGAWRLCLDG